MSMLRQMLLLLLLVAPQRIGVAPLSLLGTAGVCLASSVMKGGRVVTGAAPDMT